MAYSQRPTISQLRGLYLLVGECVELGRDPQIWRRHLSDALTTLIPNSVALVYELYPARLAEGEVMPALVDAGWADDGARDAFLSYLDSGAAGENPLLGAIMGAPSDFLATRATRVLPRDGWAGLRVTEYIREAQLDLDCITTASCHGPKRNVLTVHRHRGERPLSTREMNLLRLLHLELRPRLGGALASFGEPSVLELPPRQRAVLFWLLTGESVKETATRLGLSEHTVRDYTKAIHTHFGVSTRAELIAEYGALARSPNGWAHAEDT